MSSHKIIDVSVNQQNEWYVAYCSEFDCFGPSVTKQGAIRAITISIESALLYELDPIDSFVLKIKDSREVSL